MSTPPGGSSCRAVRCFRETATLPPLTMARPGHLSSPQASRAGTEVETVRPTAGPLSLAAGPAETAAATDRGARDAAVQAVQGLSNEALNPSCLQRAMARPPNRRRLVSEHLSCPSSAVFGSLA